MGIKSFIKEAKEGYKYRSAHRKEIKKAEDEAYYKALKIAKVKEAEKSAQRRASEGGVISRIAKNIGKEISAQKKVVKKKKSRKGKKPKVYRYDPFKGF